MNIILLLLLLSTSAVALEILVPDVKVLGQKYDQSDKSAKVDDPITKLADRDKLLASKGYSYSENLVARIKWTYFKEVCSFEDLVYAVETKWHGTLVFDGFYDERSDGKVWYIKDGEYWVGVYKPVGDQKYGPRIELVHKVMADDSSRKHKRYIIDPLMK